MGRYGFLSSSPAILPNVVLGFALSWLSAGFAISRTLATCFTKNVLPEPQGASITNVYGGSTATRIFRKSAISPLRCRGSWVRASLIASAVGSSSTRFMVAAFFLWARVVFRFNCFCKWARSTFSFLLLSVGFTLLTANDAWGVKWTLMILLLY